MGIDAEMFVKLKFKPTQEQLYDWHYKFGCAFHEHLWAFGTYEDKVPDELYLQPIEEFEQEGDSIIPKEGEYFLRIRPKTRYYGPDYERGDILTLINIAQYLEVLIPGCEVYYGGDSSGILAELFDETKRQEYFMHFATHQPSPYFARVKYTNSNNPECPYCKQVTTQFGFGGNYASYSCLGCGWKYKRRDDKLECGWNVKELF